VFVASVIPSGARDRPVCPLQTNVRLYLGQQNPKTLGRGNEQLDTASLGTSSGRNSGIHEEVWNSSAGLLREVRGSGNAIRREKQIKGYARVEKLALIGSLNAEWRDLAEDWFADVKLADPSLRSG
jgi:hypothetical protein